MPKDQSGTPELCYQLPAVRLAAGPQRREYAATLIQAGRVRTRDGGYADWIIPAATLQQAAQANLFSGKAVFIDHAEGGLLGSEYPSLRNLVGVTANAHYNPINASVEGIIRLYDNTPGQWVAALLDQIVADQAAGRETPDIGLSLVFFGVHSQQEHNGEVLRVTHSIRHVESVDLVFGPAAAGRVKAALSKHSVSMQKGVEPMSEQRPILTPTQEPEPQAAPDQLGPGAEDAARQLLGQVASLRAEVERLTALKVQQLSEEVNRLRAALGQQLEPGVVRGMGTPTNERRSVLAPLGGMQSPLERITLAYEHLMGLPTAGNAPRLTGIRELYLLLTGDRDLSGRFNPERLAYDPYDASGNNADTTTMAELTRNVMNKVMVQQIELLTEYRWWERIAYVEDFNTLQQISWVRMGGIGDLPTVSEKAAYTQLAWDDARVTADFSKYGGYLPLSLEMIDRDDVAGWRSVPRQLATAAAVTLAREVSELFTDNAGVGPQITTEGQTAYAFSATWGNLISAPLDSVGWNTAVETMYKLTQLNVSGRRQGVRPRYVLVPIELETNAIAAVTSERRPGTNYNDRVPTKRMLPEENVITVPDWTDPENWVAVADPQLCPFVGVGFRYGRTPELFTASDPNSMLLFYNDVLPIKVRWFFAVSVIDPRGAIKSNV